MNRLLQRYLNSTATFDAEKETGTKEPPKRPDIKVESVDNRKERDKDDPWNNQEEKEEEEGEEEKDDEEGDDKEDDKEEEKELTAEQKEAAKQERKDARMQKRIDKLTALNGNFENEIKTLKAQLAEKPVEGLTEQEVDRRAEAKAQALADAREKDRKQKDFEKTADTLIKDAKKADKDFEKKINEVAKETDVFMPGFMINILSEIDNGGEILASLSNDPDLYEEVCTLSERSMTRRLDKMSEEIKAAKKSNGKQQQRRPDPPPPVEPVDGVSNRGNSLPSNPTKNMEEFVRIRALQTEARRKARGY